jgi:hypothetical protein
VVSGTPSATASASVKVWARNTILGLLQSDPKSYSIAVLPGTLAPAAPTIAGAAQVGTTLSASIGAAPSGASPAVRWYRGASPISGATGLTYKLAATDIGQAMSVEVTWSKAEYTTAVAASAPTAKVLGTFAAPTPTVAGTPRVGKVLTVKPGTAPVGASAAIQWYRDGTAIPNARSATYKATSTDIGKALSATVTWTKPNYVTVAKPSKATAKVLGILTAPKPTISGTPEVGKKLTAKPGKWTTGTKLTYQWYRGAKKIPGATKSSYTLKATDKGKKVSVKVTGSKTNYVKATKASASKTIR